MRKMLLKKRRTTDEREETEDPRGGTRHQVAEDSCHSTNRGVSTPGLLRALESPSTLTGPAHQRYLPSARESIYRRADAFLFPTATPVRPGRGLRVCAYKSRQSRIPGGGLSRGGGGAVHHGGGSARRSSCERREPRIPGTACMQMVGVYIVRKEPRTNM